MSMTATATITDIVLLSACAFMGNVGKAITGFGNAIIFLFVWNIAEVSGYGGDFKYAVFIQSLALFCIQPIAIYNAEIMKNAYRRILLLFVPITLISTPLGQLLSEYVPTKTVQAVAGVIVALVAVYELYTKRDFFLGLCKKKENGSGNKSVTGVAKDDAVEVVDSIGEKGNDSEDHVEGAAPEDAGGSGPDAMASSKKTVSFSAHKATGGDDEEEGNGEQEEKESDEFEDDIPGAQVSKPDSSDPATQKDELKIGPNKATFVTLLAGGASGFLGGMVAIRGPPLIFYFLHPPKPVKFNKNTQRATASVIAFFNVFMRQCFYLYNTFSESTEIGYQKEDWVLYTSVIVCSIAGVLVGNTVFEYIKDSKNTIRAILAVFLLLSGVGLLFSAFR